MCVTMMVFVRITLQLHINGRVCLRWALIDHVTQCCDWWSVYYNGTKQISILQYIRKWTLFHILKHSLLLWI